MDIWTVEKARAWVKSEQHGNQTDRCENETSMKNF